MSAKNGLEALIRRLEMTLARQRLSVSETELQLEAARQMAAAAVDKVQVQLPLKR